MSEPYTYVQAAERAGISVDLASRFWVALGFPLDDNGAAVFTEEDVEALRFAADLIRSGSVHEDVALQVTRTMASSIARIADAQTEVAVDRAKRLGPGEGAMVDPTVVERMPWILGYIWRKHMVASLRREMESGEGDDALAVGFADLVGFTALSQELRERELAQVVDRFTTLAYETVVSLGGRVIKTIGDEVMYAADEIQPAVDIGLGLAAAYRDDERLSDVRVGVAFGEVLDHDGDLFGTPVNLASRITAIARPGSVVVSEAVHDALAELDRYRWRSIRSRNLKGIGRVPLWRVRRAD